MMISILTLLLITLFGSFSVFNCGANKKKKEEEKKKEEDKKRAEEEKKREEEKEQKARLLEYYQHHQKWAKQLYEQNWKAFEEYGSSCAYLEQFCECDFLKRLKEIYNDVRYSAYWRANRYPKINVGDWLKFDLELAETFLPFLRKTVQEAKDKHKDHLDKKDLDELDVILKNVEADYEKIKEAQKKHEKEKKDKEITTEIKCRREYIKNKKGWMLPSYYDDYDEATPVCSKHIHTRWERKDIEKVMGTCQKNLHGSKCDFIERGNFYVAAWRKHANLDLSDSMKLVFDAEVDEPYEPSDLTIVTFDVKLSDDYMKKLEKAKEEHKGLKDHLDANEIDIWFESHVEKTKELKRTLDELKNGKEDEKNQNWKKIIGYETFPVGVSLDWR